MAENKHHQTIEPQAAVVPEAASESETQQPQTQKAYAEPVKHKLHHSYIWLGAIRAIPIILLAIFCSSGSLIGEFLTNPDFRAYSLPVLVLLLLSVVVIVGIVLLIRAIAYKYIWYEFANEEFSYHNGIFSKKHVHVPYQRIQSVNQKASFLQRIAGVCTVNIETAGGADNKAVVISYIEKSAAEALRLELFSRKQYAQAGVTYPVAGAVGFAPTGMPYANMPAPAPVPVAPAGYPAGTMAAGSAPVAPSTAAPISQVGAPSPVVYEVQEGVSSGAAYGFPAMGNALDAPAQAMNEFRGIFGGAEVYTGQVSYEYGLSNKELILSAITGKTSFVLVMISIIGTLASLFSTGAFMLGVTEDALVDVAASYLASLPPSLYVGAAVSMVGSFLTIMVIIWVVLVLGTCISYGGFRARRRGNRIETEFGILSHNFNGIDIERIQSVEVSQSFFQRLLHSCTISLARVTSASQDSSSSSSDTSSQAKLIIHPFVKVSEVDTILHNLLPEWEDIPATTNKLPRRALRRAIIRKAVLQGSGFWLAISALACLLGFGIPLMEPVSANMFAPGEMADYLVFYGVLQIIVYVLLVLAVLLAVLDVISAVLWQRNSGFGYSKTYLTITNSGFSTDKTITPRSKVQLATLRTNPLQHRKELTTIVAETAAGVGSSKLRLIDVEQVAGQAWFAWCHPGGNR